MPSVSIRAYAKMRGCSHVSVLRAIKRGTLKSSVTGKGNETKIDAVVADKEWPHHRLNIAAPAKKLLKKAAAGSKLKKLPTDKDEGLELEGTAIDPVADGADESRLGYFKSRASKEDLSAKLLEMKLKRAQGELVGVDVVTKAWAGIASKVRTKVLGIPSKASQMIVGFTNEHREALEQIVRDALEDLANGESQTQTEEVSA